MHAPIVLIVLASLAIPFASSNPLPTDPIVLFPASDDVMADHGGPDRNYNGLSPGGEPTVLIWLTDSWTWYGGEDSRYALLKFATPPGTLAAAPTRMCLFAHISFEENLPPERISVYEVPRDDWTESTVTWNNAPRPGPHVASAAAGVAGWYGFDVSDPWLAALESEDAALSFKIRLEDPGVLKYAQLASRDSDHPPRLEPSLSCEKSA